MDVAEIAKMSSGDREKLAKDLGQLLNAVMGKEQEAKDSAVIWVRNNHTGNVDVCTRGIYRTSLRGANFEPDQFTALTPDECELEEQKVAMAKFDRDERAAAVVQRRVRKMEQSGEYEAYEIAQLAAELDRREAGLMELRGNLAKRYPGNGIAAPDKPKRGRQTKADESSESEPATTNAEAEPVVA